MCRVVVASKPYPEDIVRALWLWGTAIDGPRSVRASTGLDTKTMNIRREQGMTWVAVAWTVIASSIVLYQVGQASVSSSAQAASPSPAEIAFFLLVAGFLFYGNIGYQWARLGYLRRLIQQDTASTNVTGLLTEGGGTSVNPPRLTILVPSYKEELDVIRQTLLSAALQQYPSKRVVLLLDDPPQPKTAQDQAALEAARQLPGEIERLLDGPAFAMARAQQAFEARVRAGALMVADEYRELSKWYQAAAQVLTGFADQCSSATHTDRWFRQSILDGPAQRLRHHAYALHLRAATHQVSREQEACEELTRGYQALVDLFLVEVTSFERKRYVNLSHEPNKAMNLNGYLGVMGKAFRTVEGADGVHLKETTPDQATQFIPSSPYVITLDADSLLLPDYAATLIDYIERPGHERMAVVQTPYSAIPGAPGAMERTAGATTDIQYMIHQGFTAWKATFWVGANALIRTAALNDILVFKEERGYQVPCYIQDATVIEDTESTIDLIAKGWQLYNYPERLAYSATPSDFGSLVIQRGRWANGGLLILPKFLRYLWQAPKTFDLMKEAFYRIHYLTSLAGAPLSVLCLLLYPFSPLLLTMWLPLSALPYFVLYGRDLSLMGYAGWRDLLRVSALNLLLIPVHLSGAVKSLQQAWTGQKTPFQRTPKISGRTRAPKVFVVLEYTGVLYGLGLSVYYGLQGRWVSGAFMLANVGLLLYGIVRFLGLKESLADLRNQPESSTAVLLPINSEPTTSLSHK